MPRDPFVLSLALLCLLLGCAELALDQPSYHPPPFNRTVSWYDDYRPSAKACPPTNSQPLHCP